MPRRSYLADQLEGAPGPVIAVSDFMKAVPDQIARFVSGPFVALGTDGYGISDTRIALRRHFEVDTGHVVVAVLDRLAVEGTIGRDVVAKAIARYDIDPDTPEPRLV